MSTDGDNIVRGRIRRLAAVRGRVINATEFGIKKETKEASATLSDSKMLGPAVDEYDDIVSSDDMVVGE